MKLSFSPIQRIHKAESGQALLLVAIILPMIVLFCAIAVDIGILRDQKAQLQSAADAAAIAAALQIPHCDEDDCTAMTTAATQSMTINGYKNVTLVKQCADPTGSGVRLTVNNGPCAIATDPNYGNNQYAEVVLSEPEPTFFAKFIGIDNVTISARAEAKNIPWCMIFSANNTSSTASPGMQFNLQNLSANISASCGLTDDSGASDAMTANQQTTSTTLDTAETAIHGGFSTDIYKNVSFSPKPQTYAPPVQDPLSYVTAPTTSSTCTYGTTDISSQGTYTLSPGTYCGPITIASNQATVVFKSGLYYLTANSQGQGGITISEAASISGKNVTFYFDSGSINMEGLVPTDLEAPTTGTYTGILFFQNRTDSTPMTLIGDTGSKFQGAVYALNAPLTVLGVNDAAYTIIDTGSLNEYVNVGILDSILSTLNGETFHVGDDYSSLPYGSPVKAGSAVLAE